jgi:hypothetical protein
VTKDIVEYRQSHPKNLFYVPAEKRFILTNDFCSYYSLGQWCEYEGLLARFQRTYVEHIWHDQSLEMGPISTVEPASKTTQVITRAIAQKRTVKLLYRSMNNPQGDERTIHPHALANSGLRWHCRAYDNKRNEFRDFHLGRIANARLSIESSIDSTNDKAWASIIDIIIAPHPKLTPGQQKLVMLDHKGETSFTLKSRAAMAQYTLQYLGVTSTPDKDNPKAHPLFVLNLEHIKHWLF